MQTLLIRLALSLALLLGAVPALAQTPGGTGNQTLGFTYNLASQIKQRDASNDAYAYTGDYNVNRTYAKNGLNQYTTAGPATFTYDPNGNLTSDGSVGYGYDVENRIIGATGGRTAALRCDPNGRLYETSAARRGRRGSCMMAMRWWRNMMALASCCAAISMAPGLMSR